MKKQSKKRKVGAEMFKRQKSRPSNASKCKKLTDLFGSSSTSTSATEANIEVLDR